MATAMLSTFAFVTQMPVRTRRSRPARRNTVCSCGGPISSSKQVQSASLSRRALLTSAASLALTTCVGPFQSSFAAVPPTNAAATKAEGGTTSDTAPPAGRPPRSGLTAMGTIVRNGQQLQVYRTPSGITFFDVTPGEGPMPKWGDYVNIHYVLYTLTTTGDSLIKEDSSYDRGDGGFTVHHGNGEVILGLEEMLHSMPVGCRRRCIIPENLAYFQPGFIPIPGAAWTRKKLSKHLSASGGTVVFDVEMRWLMDDPDDRGYYTDLVPESDEEVIQIFKDVEDEMRKAGEL